MSAIKNDDIDITLQQCTAALEAIKTKFKDLDNPITQGVMLKEMNDSLKGILTMLQEQNRTMQPQEELGASEAETVAERTDVDEEEKIGGKKKSKPTKRTAKKTAKRGGAVIDLEQDAAKIFNTSELLNNGYNVTTTQMSSIPAPFSSGAPIENDILTRLPPTFVENADPTLSGGAKKGKSKATKKGVRK